MLHERVYALKYVMEGGQVHLGAAQRSVEYDLEQVRTASDGMIDPESVSQQIIDIVEATLENEH